MVSFITAFALLLVPILVLLIVRIRRRQRILYSHTFLKPLSDRRLREFLLRTFQLYYDVAADLLLALLLALVLSGVLDLSPRRIAVCLDGSFSMTRGESQSPLDRALELLAADDFPSRRYRLFVAGYDPQTNRHTLFDFGRQEPGQSAEALEEQLALLPVFFSSDPQTAAELLQRGYRRVIYLTDRFSGSGSGLEVVEVGEEPTSFFYPLSADYREEQESFRLRIFRQGFTDPIQIWRYEEEKGLYSRLGTLPPQASSGPVSEIGIGQEGLYRLSGGGLDFLLSLSRFTIRVTTEGPFSALMAEILPGVQSGAEGVLLADISWRANEPESLDRVIGKRRGILTIIPETAAERPPALRPHIQPLRDSLSLPTYAELPEEIPKFDRQEGRLFFLDPRRLRDAGTPLVYLSALWSRRPDDALKEPGAAIPGARLSPSRSGTTSFAYRHSDRTMVVNLPPEEFFPLERRDEHSFPEPARSKAGSALVPAALLMLLYLLKLLYLARLHGRSLVSKR